jgi:hypothetical protein
MLTVEGTSILGWPRGNNRRGEKGFQEGCMDHGGQRNGRRGHGKVCLQRRSDFRPSRSYTSLVGSLVAIIEGPDGRQYRRNRPVISIAAIDMTRSTEDHAGRKERRECHDAEKPRC